MTRNSDRDFDDRRDRGEGAPEDRLKPDLQQVWSDPRITAYALGELSPPEAEHFEQAIAADPVLAEAVDEAKQLLGMLGEQYAREPLPSLDASRRETVWREIASVPAEQHDRYRRRPPLMRLALLAASILLPIAVLGYWQFAPGGRATPLALESASDGPSDFYRSDATVDESELSAINDELRAGRQAVSKRLAAEPHIRANRLPSEDDSRKKASDSLDDAAFGMSAEAEDAAPGLFFSDQAGDIGGAGGYGGMRAEPSSDMAAEPADASRPAAPSQASRRRAPAVSPEAAGPPAPVEMRLQERHMQRESGVDVRFRTLAEDSADGPPAAAGGEVDGLGRRAGVKSWSFNAGAAEKLRAVLIEARRWPEPDEVDVPRMINDAASQPLALGLPTGFPNRVESEIAQSPWQPGHALMLRTAAGDADDSDDGVSPIAEKYTSGREGAYRIRPFGERDADRLAVQLDEIIPAAEPPAEPQQRSAPRRSEPARLPATAIAADRLNRPFAEASPTFRRVAVVAAFGLQLQRSERRGTWTLSDVLEAAEAERGDGEDPQWDSWLELIRAAAALEQADADAR